MLLSVDEVCLDLDPNCRYALVIQDFFTGNPIDLLSSRRTNDTEPYFMAIPLAERASVKYLISDMYIRDLIKRFKLRDKEAYLSNGGIIDEHTHICIV